ncbi:MAG: hypothetical protein ABIJ86_01860, partial [Spirochaetota bacterium]
DRTSHAGMNRPLARTGSAPSLEVTVAGASHHDFTDMAYSGVLSLVGVTGSVDGYAAGEGIQQRILAFLRIHMLGESLEFPRDDAIFSSIEWAGIH